MKRTLAKYHILARIIAVGLLVGLAIVACVRMKPTPLRTLTLKVLTQGLQLRHDGRSPRFFVINNEDAWVDFWQSYAPEGQTTALSVDFGVAFVLIGIQGAKSTGGYAITFSALRTKGQKVHVITDLEEPAAGESFEMAFTQPYIIVEVESAQLATQDALTFIFETAAGQELGRVTQSIHRLKNG